MNNKVHVSEKAIKIDKIFTVNLTLCSNHQIEGELSIFVAFLEDMNFNRLELCSNELAIRLPNVN